MKFRLAVILIIFYSLALQGQTPVKPERLDVFGKISNDDLQARVLYFQEELSKDESTGLAVLYGPPLLQYFNQRRITGCNRFMRISEENIRYKFVGGHDEVRVEFWKIPKGFNSPELVPNEPDYKLELVKPVEMTASMATDEFCPRFFEIDWYAKFLLANPSLNGRAVFDVRTKKDFVARVRKYKKELLGLGVASDRMRYYHKHFRGERDEQFWLVPPIRK